MDYHDTAGTLIGTDTFTHVCGDCGGTLRVVHGVEDDHDCPMPVALRGRVGGAVLEAFVEDDTAALRDELVQVAAVAVNWIQAIDRRTDS